MNKKIILAFGVVLSTGALLAGPHGGHRGGHIGPRPAPSARFRPAPPPPHHHHGRGSLWGRGGRNFWPGFVGGVVGGVLVDRVVAPTVVTTPVVTAPVVAVPTVVAPTYVSQQVWVPGVYVDQVQANGTVVRVWQPGHYESRSVLVQ